MDTIKILLIILYQILSPVFLLGSVPARQKKQDILPELHLDPKAGKNLSNAEPHPAFRMFPAQGQTSS
jgi:hypothetical protein